MAARMRLVGSYDSGHAPWRLVELAIYDLDAPLDLGALGIAGTSASPYDVRLLDGSGTREVADDIELRHQRERLLVGDLRLCFFIAASEAPILTTPLGDLPLGPAAIKPARLRFIRFYAP